MYVPLASFPDFPLSSFRSLIVCKNGGGRPRIFYYINEVSVYLGGQSGGGVYHQKYAFCARIFCFEPEVLRFSLHECSKLQRLGQKRQNKVSSSFFRCGTLPRKTLISFTWQKNIPGLPPPFLHTTSDQKLDSGKTWERSYVPPQLVPYGAWGSQPPRLPQLNVY